MRKFAFHPEAEAELLEASRYYESCRKGLGPNFLIEVRRVIKTIVANPGIGAPLEGGIRKRRLERFPYNLLYSTESFGIYIIAVMHQKRRPDYWRWRS